MHRKVKSGYLGGARTFACHQCHSEKAKQLATIFLPRPDPVVLKLMSKYHEVFFCRDDHTLAQAHSPRSLMELVQQCFDENFLMLEAHSATVDVKHKLVLN